MIGMWFVWAGLLLYGVCLATFGRMPFGAVLAAVTLLMPLLSLLLRTLVPPRLSAAVTLPKSGDQDCRLIGTLTLHHPGHRVCRRVRLTVQLVNCLTEEVQERTLTLSLSGRGDASLAVAYRALHCGRMEFRLCRARVYDFFGLTFRTVPLTAVGTTLILPTLEPGGEDLPFFSAARLDSETYAEDHPGPDLSEPYDFREYVPGDSVHAIQWKLSEKQGKLMVRRGSDPVDDTLCLALWAGNCHDPKRLSAMAQQAVSVSVELCERRICHDICLDDGYYPVHDLDDLAAVLPKWLVRHSAVPVPGDERPLLCFAAEEPVLPAGVPVTVVTAVPHSGKTETGSETGKEAGSAYAERT